MKRVVDVRLNNNLQLAGFSKKNDLPDFFEGDRGIDYVHLPELAPTQDILDAYKKNKGHWDVYEKKFLDLMARREIEKKINPELLSRWLPALQRTPATSIVIAGWLPSTSTPNGAESS